MARDTQVNCSRAMDFCAREASQIMGGASFLRTGKASQSLALARYSAASGAATVGNGLALRRVRLQGEVVERIYRDVRGTAIPGGSEEILLELATKLNKL